MLDLTIIFDPEVIDGALATRFARNFVERIGSGYGLEKIRPMVWDDAGMLQGG